jgi:uncharacterized repeat protein (TIGR03803 family)
LSGNTVYGTTESGGITNSYWPWSCGTVFKINTDGSGFTTLYSFTGTNGAYPAGNLLLSGTTLYGLTEWLGSSFQPDYGTVFSVNADGSGFRTLKCFTNFFSDGILGQGSLASSGSTLYGVAWGGGSGGNGRVFKMNADGSGFAVLKDLTRIDGRGSLGGVALSDTTLYGTTQLGGISDLGVLFAMGNPPTMQTPPRSQTAEMGSSAGFQVNAEGAGPLCYQWLFNTVNAVSSGTNHVLVLTNIQPSQAGAYTLVITNVIGAVTSSPAMLQVIAPVERRLVPALNLFGDAGSLLSLDYAHALPPAPDSDWIELDTVHLTSTSQFYFDLAAPLPAQRFYRAWQDGTPPVLPSLDLRMVPAITLSGNIGESLRLDYINAIGPTDAWVTLATVTLTDTSQLYFDVSSIGKPTRLYRIVRVP